MTPTEALANLNISVQTIDGPRPHNEDNWQAIEYVVRVMRGDKEVIQTEYRLGLGHVDLKKTGVPWKYMSTSEQRMLEAWQKKPYANFVNKDLQANVAAKLAKFQKVTPKAEDVIYSLVMDSSALDHSDFESWAREYGYDTDSRKAEGTYKACLEIALKMRSAFGEDCLNLLREAFQDY